MSAKHTLPISEARRKIFAITDDVQKPGRYYTLTENGRPKAVILSAEEFESFIETVEVLAEFPDLDADIAAAERAAADGKTISLEDLLVKQGFVMSKKGGQMYVSRRVRSRRRKTAK